jgi:hypothetical protein
MAKRHSTFFSSTENIPQSLALTEKRPRIKLRDGEVAIYLRTQSQHWQCVYKLKDIGAVRRTVRAAVRTQNVHSVDTLK